MAGDWIPMRMNLEDDPTVVFIARATKLKPDYVVGKLHRLWSWIDANSRDGKLIGIDAAWVDHYVRKKGFAQAMATAPHPWLKINSNSVTIPNFSHWFGSSAKQRLTNTKRQQSCRLRKTGATDSATNGATKARPQDRRVQDRREENNTTPPTPNSNLHSATESGGGGVADFGEAWKRSKQTAEKLRAIIEPDKSRQLSKTEREWIIRVAILADRFGEKWLAPALEAAKSTKNIESPKGLLGKVLNEECERIGTTLNRALASVSVPESMLEIVAKRPSVSGVVVV